MIKLTKKLTLNVVFLLMLSANVLLLINYTIPGILLGFSGILIYTAEQLSHYKKEK